MAARVVTVDREAKRSWIARRLEPAGPLGSHTMGLVRALARLVGAGKPDVGLPGLGNARGAAEPSDLEGRRGLPVLVEGAAGLSRCRPCPACTEACPAHCIEVEIALVPPAGAADPALGAFRLDAARCIGCGLCAEVCPEAAIAMSEVVDLAVFARGDLQYEKEQLLVPSSRLHHRGARGADSRS